MYMCIDMYIHIHMYTHTYTHNLKLNDKIHQKVLNIQSFDRPILLRTHKLLEIQEVNNSYYYTEVGLLLQNAIYRNVVIVDP